MKFQLHIVCPHPGCGRLHPSRWPIWIIVVAFLMLSPKNCAAQSTHAARTLRVKIEASDWDRKLLLEKLNAHAAGHRLKFDLVDKDSDEGFDYRIVFATEQQSNVSYLGLNTSTARAQVFDGKGNELFQFQRGGRSRDTGAANAAAKEIIKRILQIQPSATAR